MVTKKFEEHRHHRRRPVGSYASLLVHAGTLREGQAFCLVLDASEGGLRARTPQPPRVGDAVNACVAVGEEIFELTGIVVRVKKLGSVAHDVGLSFLMDPVKVRSFLSAVTQAPIPCA